MGERPRILSASDCVCVWSCLCGKAPEWRSQVEDIEDMSSTFAPKAPLLAPVPLLNDGAHSGAECARMGALVGMTL